ncbi:hypothetical protein VP01_150g2 [Puccinia sorghi]|uniref:Uncharacterized protein n=1 Tax=Puccinia sorghi TaxID=27349 RepID=A0A0L6VKR4_9BASI|nr:hypothetical protein VP01_150g2 [Puccinia sorghi]
MDWLRSEWLAMVGQLEKMVDGGQGVGAGCGRTNKGRGCSWWWVGWQRWPGFQETLEQTNFYGFPVSCHCLKDLNAGCFTKKPQYMQRSLKNKFSVCHKTFGLGYCWKNHDWKFFLKKEGDVILCKVLLHYSGESQAKISFFMYLFSIVPRFSITINKIQGKTLYNAAVFSKFPCFAHGQLVVSLSRVTNLLNLHMLQSVQSDWMTQVVHHDLLNHL